MACGIVRDDRMRNPVLPELPRGQASPLIARAGLVDPDMHRDARIVGRVRNLPDGSVEIEAAGSSEDLALFEEEIRKGPRGSRVDTLEEEGIAPVPAWDRFEIDR